MSKSRNIADLGSDDVLETTATGISVTGTITSDGLVVDGDITIAQAAGGTFLKFDVDGTIDEALIGMDSTDLIISVDPTNVRASSDFVIKNDGTETFRIDSSGNVGIGTSSPSVPLHINMGGENTGLFLESTDVNSNLIFQDGDSTANVALGCVGDAFRIQNGGLETLRIDASGNVLVGTTSLGGVNGLSISPAAGTHTSLQFNASSTGNYAAYFKYYGTNVGTISYNGSSTAYNTSSDYRLKTDVQPMAGASERVQALKPVNFEWIADGTRVDGFLAHEAQEVVPEAVTGAKDAMQDEEYEVTPAVLDEDDNETSPAVMATRRIPDMQGIDQSKIVPLLTAALQEALTKISTMEARLVALES
jgi:hypothetical protein